MKTARAVATDVAPGNLADLLASHLSAHGRRYYPELGDGALEARLVQHDTRRVTLLYRYRLISPAGWRDVLVKAPREPVRRAAEKHTFPARPGLAVALRPAERSLREYRSLATIHDHFKSLGDPRFGAVRVLDLLREHRAFVMEVVQATSLRRLLYQAHRGCGPAAAAVLEAAFNNAGAWLREYHALVPRLHVAPRRTTRADYVRLVARLSHFLGARLGETRRFEQIAAALAHMAEEVLPEDLPLGLGHDDFALRNVLVESRSRITVLDTLARHRTVIYEDIGYFLVSLRHNWPQVFTLGAAFPAARLAACERAFLSGYFADGPVPYAAIRLYEVQAMLDRWSEIASRRADTPSWSADLKQSVRLAFMSRWLRRRVAEAIPGATEGPLP
jgi:hypothetical protein